MPDDTAIEFQKFAIGQPVSRMEDPRLLTGRGCYTDDVSVDRQVYGYVVRSQVAHGELRGVDTAAAAAAPGVLAVYTGADLDADGIGRLVCKMPFKNRDGSPLNAVGRPVLAVGRVRHVGDPIAFVVAETLAQARDAAELVVPDIAPLPVLTGAANAVSPDAPQIWEEAPENTGLNFFLGDDAATDAAFAEAAHVSRIRLDNTRMVVAAMEPRAALAQYDAATERFTLHVPSQGVAGYRATLAGMLFGVEPEKIRVISNDVGGSFGMKGGTYNEAAAAMFAARSLGRPVKWSADRSDSFLSDHQGRASDITAELAMDKDGNFLALRIRGYGDLGGYMSAMGPGPSTGVLSRNIISVYKTPVLSYAVRAVYTNTVPTGPYRGAGRPESKYIVERLIDQAARETGRDRIELRRRNLIPPDAMPYKVPVGITYDSGEFEAILDAVLERSDWAGFAARRAESEERGKLRGIGLALYLETTAPPGTELADIRFEDDGTVTLISGTRDFGTGHATPFAQVVADRLQVPFSKIRLVQNDSDMMSAGAGGSGGSRSLIATGGAVVEASAEILEKGRKVAAHVLEAAEEDIEFGPGGFRVVGTDRVMDLIGLARELRNRKNLPPGLPDSLDARVNHKTSPSSYPNGGHVCEVEIDPETGETRLLRYTVVDDFGVLVNPMIVEGQVQGGIAQGVGQVLMENTVYDESGQLLTGSFMDYALPRASDLIPVDFTTRNVPCTTNPLGVKGCGEAGNGGSMPAVMNAIMDALGSVGVTEFDMPATPARVWAAIRAARKE